jgi:tetratricopeptide (TPR) repeat protein
MIKILLPVILALYFFKEPLTKEESITVCGSPSGIVAADGTGKFMTALTGWGDLNYPISTKSDSAQFYFNQGLSLYFSYHFTEAVASFKESGRFDPDCAMAYWGQALAMGPFYNTYVYKMPKDVPSIVSTMAGLSSNASEKEKGLIAALQKRYSDDLTNADRKQLDRSYATALVTLGKKYSDDNNIKALYVDAIMLEHKWDFWNRDGSAKPWTQELVTTCETVLNKEWHPAIAHYYIHVTEASRQPGRALNAADKLKDMVPSVGHMVHMSSHMYQRNGLYAKGVKVNEDAHNANNKLDTKAPSLKLGKDKSVHYYAVQSYCAMNAGMFKEAVSIYDRARNRQVATGVNFEKETYPQFIYMIPSIARVRLGKWDEILNMEGPNANWKYAVALDNFAKGLAHVRNNNLKAARDCQVKLSAAMEDPIMKDRYFPFNSPLHSCLIAVDLLNAEIASAEGKHELAMKNYQHAVTSEDGLVYREPADWMTPARQYFGAYLLKTKQAKKAEEVYREDLVLNPDNGWSLLGLYQSLKAQGKKDAAEYEGKYKKAFADADAIPASSVF